jgi:hypothetical protein
LLSAKPLGDNIEQSRNPDHRLATIFNDIAIAGFVLDMFLVIIGWPPACLREASQGHFAAAKSI